MRILSITKFAMLSSHIYRYVRLSCPNILDSATSATFRDFGYSKGLLGMHINKVPKCAAALLPQVSHIGERTHPEP